MWSIEKNETDIEDNEDSSHRSSVDNLIDEVLQYPNDGDSTDNYESEAEIDDTNEDNCEPSVRNGVWRKCDYVTPSNSYRTEDRSSCEAARTSGGTINDLS